MENKIIDFNTAKLAKEKGFNILTEKMYRQDGMLGNSDFSRESTFRAPTQSLLQKWLREKHQLFICVKHKITGSIEEPIVEFTYNGNNGEWNSKYYSTYEYALEVALVECLQRISETVA